MTQGGSDCCGAAWEDVGGVSNAELQELVDEWRNHSDLSEVPVESMFEHCADELEALIDDD